jgi:chemotaxis protein histidine kinase CheA
MAELFTHRELRYLPIELAGQTFALPMSSVAAIHQVSKDTGDGQPSTDKSAVSLPVLDLRHLFQGGGDPGTHMYVVVVSTDTGTCALAVDRVGSTRTVKMAALHSLPYLVSTVEWLFKGVICEADNLTLLINSQQLVEQVQEMSPELVLAGGAHVS